MNTVDESSLHPVPPRVLLVEDDPTSRAFLSAVVRALPAQVDCADSIAAALALADAPHALWLLDVQLPDGDGRDLLARLRARRDGVPALAHTASTEPALHAALIAAGFAEVLVKPMTAVALATAVKRALGSTPDGSADGGDDHVAGAQPLWDDDAAGRAMNFNQMHVDALRRLFQDELPSARAMIIAAADAGDRAAVVAGLHKLRASCGFVGAARLAAAVAALQCEPLSSMLVADFDQVARDTAAG